MKPFLASFDQFSTHRQLVKLYDLINKLLTVRTVAAGTVDGVTGNLINGYNLTTSRASLGVYNITCSVDIDGFKDIIIFDAIGKPPDLFVIINCSFPVNNSFQVSTANLSVGIPPASFSPADAYFSVEIRRPVRVK